jgi:hypothetical protein
MLSKNVLRYGREASLPARVPLRAGPLTLIYEAGDLRALKLGDREVLRRVYVALRDRNWGTVPAVLSNVHMDVGDDAFAITYDAEHEQGAIHLAWRATIRGDANGTIAFALDGVARSTFMRNRIGFCVLHPMRECAGRPCRVEHTDGSSKDGAFPAFIAPHQPFMDLRALAHEVVPGVWARVQFSGDVFEMEDQRNWTDASFKTYSTPLALPFPVQVKEGTEISQSVMLTLQGRPPTLQPTIRQTEPTLTVGQEPAGRLPRIGLGVASHGRPLDEKELQRLRELNLAHLRVDLHLSRGDYEPTLRQAAAEARALGASLEVALFLPAAVRDELRSLVRVLDRIRPPVCAWLVLDEAGRTTPEELAHLAREHLQAYAPAAQIGGGTDLFFTDLNRQRPPVQALDLVCYSLNPQVHAFDNTSLIETLETQAVTVASARQFAGGRPLAVGPITLKRRSNPNATAPGADLSPGELPPQVDVRQMSLFGAAWTLGSLKYLSESRIYSATYYETSGWRGVMETEAGSPRPEAFPSLPGAVFPLYHVLADAGEFAGGEVVPVTSSDTLRVEGLALRQGDRVRLLVANLRPHVQRVSLIGLGSHARLRVLDETNAEQAMLRPQAFRTGAGRTAQTEGGTLSLLLRPYAVARIDTSAHG